MEISIVREKPSEPFMDNHGITVLHHGDLTFFAHPFVRHIA